MDIEFKIVLILNVLLLIHFQDTAATDYTNAAQLDGQ